MPTIRFTNFFKSVRILMDEDAARRLESGAPIRECLPIDKVAEIEKSFSNRLHPCNWQDISAWEIRPSGQRIISSNL